MPVDPTVPADSALVSASAAQLRANFLAVNTEIDVDHYSDTFTPPLAAPYNVAVAGDVGHHKKVDLVRVSANPAAPGADVGRLITKTVGAATQLFYQNSASVSQVSGLPITNAIVGPNQYEKSITLPFCGVVIKWGIIWIPNQGLGTYTFTTGAFPTRAMTVTLTQYSNNVGNLNYQTPVALNFTNNSFDFFGTRNAGNFYNMIAIGE